MGDLATKVDRTLEDLSQVIQNVGVHEEFPQILSQQHLDEMSCAAIYLSAAVMDCLADLIEWVTQSRRPLCQWC